MISKKLILELMIAGLMVAPLQCAQDPSPSLSQMTDADAGIYCGVMGILLLVGAKFSFYQSIGLRPGSKEEDRLALHGYSIAFCFGLLTGTGLCSYSAYRLLEFCNKLN